MSIPRVVMILAGLSVLVGGLSSCGLFSDDTSGRTLVVGDSVTYQSRGYIVKELGGGDEVEMKAHSGLRTDQLLPGAEEGVSHDPKRAIFMPGYNDVLQDRVDQSKLPEMIDLAAQVPCTVWLLLPTKGVYSASIAEDWNQRVRDQAAEYDTIHLVDDWARLVDNSQEYTFVKTEDGLHPNPLGRKAIGEVMAKSINRECPA
jgi:hypothetical protein